MPANAASDTRVQYFIHQVRGLPRDFQRCGIHAIELPVVRLASQVLQLVHDSKRPALNLEILNNWNVQFYLKSLANLFFSFLILSVSQRVNGWDPPDSLLPFRHFLPYVQHFLLHHLRMGQPDAQVYWVVEARDEILLHVHVWVTVIPREQLLQFIILSSCSNRNVHIGFLQQPHL